MKIVNFYVGCESHSQIEEAFNDTPCSQTQVTIIFTIYLNKLGLVTPMKISTNELKFSGK